MLEFRRVIANFLDFFLIYSISFIFLSQEYLTSNLEYYNLISKSSSLSLKHLVACLCLLFFYRFYCALLFSVSLGQLIMGLNFKGDKFLNKRLSSAFRIVLLPLVIIIQFTDKYFKNEDKKFESFVFGPLLEVKKSSLRDIIAGISFIILFSLFCLSPFLYFGPFHFNPKVSVYLKEDKKLQSNIDFNLFKSYGSKSLEFNTFSDLAEGRFKINPSYELKRNSGKLIYRPIVSIWDKSLGIKGLFKISKRFDFYKLLIEFRNNLLFFNSQYPHLNEFLNNFDEKNDNSAQLDDKAKRELFDLISTSLVTTPLNILNIYKEGHFYFFPYLIFKDKLFELMGNESEQKIDFVQKGDDLFLRTIYKDDFNENYRERFFTYNSLRPIIYEVIWQKNSYEQEVNDLFNNSFFTNVKWGSDVLNEVKLWERDYLFNPISIVDFIGLKSFSKDGLVKFENYLYDYFFVQARDSLKMSTTYQNLLIASMQRLFVVWQLKIKSENIPFSKLTIKKFSDMIKALELRDNEYFRKN